MKKTLLAVLVLVLGLSSSSCLIVDGSSDAPFDFNGVWSFALNGCQGQVANLTITQRGTSFVMVSEGPFETLVWLGSCDPWAGTFSATASGAWGTWTFSGGATGPDAMSGAYDYLEYRVGQCGGSFGAQRIAYRGVEAPPGPALQRHAP